MDGWEVVPPPNDFAALWGPLRRQRAGGRWRYRLQVRDCHRNGAGVMHGGAMTALLDEVVGTIVAEETGRRHVTVQIAATFLKPARVGDVVEVGCEIVRVTGSMAFVEAKLLVADEAIATASLIFKAARPEAS